MKIHFPQTLIKGHVKKPDNVYFYKKHELTRFRINELTQCLMLVVDFYAGRVPK